MNDDKKTASYSNLEDFFDVEQGYNPVPDTLKSVESYPTLSQAFLKALLAIGSKCSKLKQMIRDN